MPDAPSIRKELLEVLRAAAYADSALFYLAGPSQLGPRAFSNHVATDAVMDATAAALNSFLTEHPNAIADPREARDVETRSFLESAALFGPWDEFAARPMTRWIRERSGLGDQIRLLAFDGERFLGWVGAFRRWGAPPFGPRERQALNALLPRCIADLVAADALERAHLPTASAFLIVTPDGHVEHASEEARPWLERGEFGEALAGTVAALERGEPLLRGDGGVLVWRASARVTRLDGDGGVRYLVAVAPAASFRRGAGTRLSPTQRRVAKLLADGLRRREVAELLGLGEETVRSHAREVYRRLDVADRFELRRVLAELGEEHEP